MSFGWMTIQRVQNPLNLCTCFCMIPNKDEKGVQQPYSYEVYAKKENISQNASTTIASLCI